jgi:GNAT superfamily N-acetyltransferase
MKIEVSRARVDEIAPLRELYRKEMACQIVHDSFPGRGLSDPYLLWADGRLLGYGTVSNRYEKGAVDEFYTLPAHRGAALPAFREFLTASGAVKIRAQTNDPLLLLLLYDCARKITSDTILFHDAFTSHLTVPGAVARQVTDADRKRMFAHGRKPEGEWMIEHEGTAVATGGALFHYNPPYGDLFMEVFEPYRRRGFGSYLVQELKRVCYETGKVPAARCNSANVASRRTLEKAGMLPCARILVGEVSR